MRGRRRPSESCMNMSADSCSHTNITTVVMLVGAEGGVSYRDVCAILMYTEKHIFLSRSDAINTLVYSLVCFLFWTTHSLHNYICGGFQELNYIS